MLTSSHFRSAPLRILAAMAMIAGVLSVATPARANSMCVEDSAGDVEDRNQEVITDKGEADILAACMTVTPEYVEISVRVAVPTDPATGEAWRNRASAVGAAIDLGGALNDQGNPIEEFDVNLAQWEDGVASVRTFNHATEGQICETDAIYDDVRYRMRVPMDCIGNPALITIAPFIFYQSDPSDPDDQGFYDEVPERPQFNGPFSTAPDPETAITRLSGAARVDTAIAVSQDDFEDGGAEAVVLARADIFPDALVAAPLATAVNGPLLLTPSFAVTQSVEDELARVLPPGGTIYLSGGEAALTDDVRTELEALGYLVERAAGPSRYATAVEVARASVADPALIVVADGNDFPDALVGGSLAASEGGVEILSNGEVLDDTATAYLSEHPDAEVVAIGAVAAQAAPTATAIAGNNSFDTAVQVAEARYPEADGVGVASGTNFPDGLTGGAHAGRRQIPLLLSYPGILPDSVETYLDASAPLSRAFLYGGVVALEYQVEADVAARMAQ